MNEPLWIDLKGVLAAHDEQISAYGGLAGIRDLNMLESALAKPRQAFFYAEPVPDIYELAALYMTGIARNHPFNDANKRTSFVVAFGFLKLNGMALHIGRDGFADIIELMLKVAKGDVDAGAVAEWMRARVK